MQWFRGGLIRYSCITQLKAQGPSKTCNESKEGEEEAHLKPARTRASICTSSNVHRLLQLFRNLQTRASILNRYLSYRKTSNSTVIPSNEGTFLLCSFCLKMKQSQRGDHHDSDVRRLTTGYEPFEALGRLRCAYRGDAHGPIESSGPRRTFKFPAYRGTSLIRKCHLQGPYGRPIPRALGRSWEGWRFPMREVPM